MGDVTFMANHTWIQKRRLFQSHISLHRPLKPISDTFSLPSGDWSNSKRVNTEDLLGHNSPLMYTINLPPLLSFDHIQSEEGTQFICSSSRGVVRFLVPARFFCQIQERSLTLGCDNPQFYREFRTLVGAFYRTLLGVTKGYGEKLKTVGVGYKGKLEENRLLRMVLGYSHPLYYFLDQSIRIKFSRKNNRFNLRGPNSVIIHQTAANLYAFKKPDVYKGKGVRYRGLKLLKKEGKKKK